jgi:dihydroorotate dehydrogenase
MIQEPFYDPTKTYYENLEHGPFGAFTDGVIVERGAPQFTFLGHSISYPFGIPAGPLLDSKFIKAAFEKGFDVPVYKTVRAEQFPCHPFPNVLAVHLAGDLSVERMKEPLVADAQYTEPLSITNSFGVPSRPVAEWQKDAAAAAQMAGEGQVMVMSCMGTVKEGQTKEEFIADYVAAAKLSIATGAKILEINLSCPNIGNEGLVCYNVEMTREVTHAVRDAIGLVPLVLKVGYFTDDAALKEIVAIAEAYADGISSINTLQATIINEHGEQALPGPNRVKSGVCGASITWAGLSMIERLEKLRAGRGAKTALIGCGGVMNAADFRMYRDRGADIVMSATGAMWNPYLAKEIRDAYPQG